jgi:hypothetical protein
VDAVAQVELHEGAGDVGLDGRLRDDEGVGDFGLRAA